jgi:hypothetical protein
MSDEFKVTTFQSASFRLPILPGCVDYEELSSSNASTAWQFHMMSPMIKLTNA